MRLLAASCSIWLRSTADRKSTRLNSSHGYISYAVFCLKKKTVNQARVKIIAGAHSFDLLQFGGGRILDGSILAAHVRFDRVQASNHYLRILEAPAFVTA